MPPIERAARALFLAGAQTSMLSGFDARKATHDDWDCLDPELKAGFIEDARVMLLAIREPSEFMLTAAVKMELDMPRGAEPSGRDYWYVMINAAILETSNR